MPDLTLTREDVDALAESAATLPEPARSLLEKVVDAVRTAIDEEAEVTVEVEVQPVEVAGIEPVAATFGAAFAAAPAHPSGGGHVHVTFIKVGRA
jgi:hypothetical protein